MNESNDELTLNNYSPSQVEQKWQKQWDSLRAFSPNTNDKGDPFCIVTVSYTHLTLPTIYSV